MRAEGGQAAAKPGGLRLRRLREPVHAAVAMPDLDVVAIGIVAGAIDGVPIVGAFDLVHADKVVLRSDDVSAVYNHGDYLIEDSRPVCPPPDLSKPGRPVGLSLDAKNHGMNAGGGIAAARPALADQRRRHLQGVSG